MMIDGSRGLKSFLQLVAIACLILSATNAPAVIMVTGEEIWDGIQNPQAGNGVTLSNGVYTIPDELVIGSGATIFLRDTNEGALPSESITFEFSGSGGLTFTDATSILDVSVGGRNLSGRTFTLNMNSNEVGGIGPGAGQIINGVFVTGGTTGDPMEVDINSNANITVGSIDITKSDAQGRNINITAAGNVDVDLLATADVSTGGGSGASINVTASSMTLGDFDTRSLRSQGNGNNGNINLVALGPPGFDPGDFTSNTVAQNVITLDGNVDTQGVSNLEGNITLTAAKVVLDNTFTTDLSGDFNVNTGQVQPGFTQGDLFVNDSAVSPDNLNFNVFHDGVGPAVLEWADNVSGNWRQGSNWDLNAFPDANTQTAVFGSNVVDPQTVFIVSPTTIKGIQFDTTASVVLAGVDVFNLEADIGNATIESLQGSHKIQNPLTLNSDTTASAASGAELDLNNSIDLNGNTLTVGGAGTVNINGSATGGNVVVTGSLGGGSSIDGHLLSTGELAVGIGGTEEGQYGSFEVSGVADVGQGSLVVDLVNGFAPSEGDEFVVLSAAAVSAEGLSLEGSAAGVFDLVSSPTQLLLVANGQAIPEPTAAMLVLVGILGLAGVRKRSEFRLTAKLLNVLVAGTFLFACSTSSAQITVTGFEIWDGIQNPHAGDGVTLNNGVYTIPDELVIASGGSIFLQDFNTGNISNDITFEFTGSGGLTFTDETSLIDTYIGDRNQPMKFFTLNMNNNDISVVNPGAGRILNGFTVLGGQSGDTMTLNINSQADVTIGEINLLRDDAFPATVNITANGDVSIDNLISSDVSGSAAGGIPLNIVGKSITMGDIDTRNFRNDGAGANGDINLTALGPPGFSVGDFNANFAADNVITLTGDVITNSPVTNNAGGNLNLVSVKTVLESTFTADLSELADFNVDVGTVQSGFTQGDLFMNNSAVTPDSLDFSVFHDGTGPGELRWNGNFSGPWHDEGNWDLNAIPNDNTQTAIFGDNIVSTQVVFTTQATTVKGIRFDNTTGVALAGNAPITLDADSGNASVAALQGNSQVQTEIELSDNTDFSAAAGATLTFTDTIAQNGNSITVSGDGQVNINNDTSGGDVVNNGTLGTDGPTSIGGNLTSTDTLDFDIGGTGGLAFDSWDVTGNANIDGSVIDVDLVAGFTPNVSDTFTILSANSLSAAGVTLGGPDAASFNLVVNATELVLEAVAAAGVPGDYNGNGIVDSADYAVWLANLGGTTLTNRDPNAVGVVGLDDYTFWKERIGNTSGFGAGSDAVPEPTSLLLVIVGCIAGLGLGSRKVRI